MTLHAPPTGAASALLASLALALEPGPKIQKPKFQAPTDKRLAPGAWNLQLGISSPTPVCFRRDVEHGAVLIGEVGFRHALNVARLQLQKDVDLIIGGRDVVVDHGGVRQVQRLLLVALAADDVVAHELVLRALELVRGDTVCLDAFELREHLALDILERLPGRDDGDGIKQIWVLQDVRAAERRHRDPPALYEIARHSRALTVEENLRRKVQRIRV